MRKISPSLVITIAALWACSAHATPDQTGNRFEKTPSDTGLLTQINQARQNVGLRTSELVAGAMSFIGVPYRRGGSSAETGFDCSGFVRSVYERSVGLLLPRKAEEQASVTQHISKSDLRPGDLVFFNTMRRAFSHVGIYVGNGQFIHSPRPGSEVRIDSMSMDYWQNRFDGARRVPAVAAGSPQMAVPLMALASNDTGTGTGVGTPAGSDAGASTATGVNTNAGTGARTSTAHKPKPAPAKKHETKKKGGKKQALKKQDAKKQTAKKQTAKKHASASPGAKANKRAKT